MFSGNWSTKTESYSNVEGLVDHTRADCVGAVLSSNDNVASASGKSHFSVADRKVVWQVSCSSTHCSHASMKCLSNDPVNDCEQLGNSFRQRSVQLIIDDRKPGNIIWLAVRTPQTASRTGSSVLGVASGGGQVSAVLSFFSPAAGRLTVDRRQGHQ